METADLVKITKYDVDKGHIDFDTAAQMNRKAMTSKAITSKGNGCGYYCLYMVI